ncbi:extradiol dioxygenase [Sphingobium sp. SYK-6]|uniref:DODA-type extradiol aromatic ring-opening family dioxygenase n=1 Tax=Sphingobium sp. (strain NBRC 103272 / SYK-6) TaxID=627192 RepID=UPI0002276DE8|nr:class III extradiol ring-cleavage dioxygenase [Sphingobium sp. SYK-6]BAK65012.1 extradiol dioxygenase [Sphingobium sp. SYK-6]
MTNDKTTPQPSLYIPHGGGPCFFMPDPRGIWREMENYLRDMTTRLPRRPQAILLISAHWETTGFALTGAERPGLIYDYYGFPPETYEIAYPVPGAPWLAQRAADLLRAAGLEATIDPDRGLDHGVFIPMKVAFPEADIPLVEMSLDASLDPALHIRAGEAIAALREENVLVIGSGMSFHNLRAYGDPRALEPSTLFDQWLTQAALAPADARAERLIHWKDAPYARASHPRAEHLLPLMVAAGASSSPGRQDFGAVVMESAISGFSFA